MNLVAFILAFSLVACSSTNRNQQAAVPSAERKVASEEALAVPEQLRIFSPHGEAIPIKIRTITPKEWELLLLADESGEPKHTLRYWKKQPKAYYRWNLETEAGLITDMARERDTLLSMGGDASLEAYPRVVVAPIGGTERIVAIGTTYLGSVKFHSDSELRKQGCKGLGTVILADYLRWNLNRGSDAYLESVNNSYGFYQKLGFEFSNPDHTPEKVKNPELESFMMAIPNDRIASALLRMKAENQSR